MDFEKVTLNSIVGAVAVVFVCGAAYTVTELFLYWGAL